MVFSIYHTSGVFTMSEPFANANANACVDEPCSMYICMYVLFVCRVV